MGSGSSIQKRCKIAVVKVRKATDKLPDPKKHLQAKKSVLSVKTDADEEVANKKQNHTSNNDASLSQCKLISEDNFLKLENDVDAFVTKLVGDPKLEQAKLKLIRSPSFDVWECEREELVTYIMLMFGDLGINKDLNISYTTLKKWLVAVEQNYINDVFFHNFRHAFCVTQMMYFMIHELQLMKYMTTMQLTMLLVACICHDLDHPGLNNRYQQKAHTELSVLYYNRSPLEHHHCAVAFRLISANDLNIFANLKDDQFDEVSHIVIQLILATDMSIHDRILNDFRQILTEGFSFEKPEHLLALQKILVKCCDISNEVRPLETSKVWVDRLFAEFFAQAERERREGLPVEVYMQKTNVKKANDQLSFIRKIIMPLFDCLSKVFPDVNNRILRSLQESELFYERLSADEIEQSADGDVTDKNGNGVELSKFIIPEVIVSGCE